MLTTISLFLASKLGRYVFTGGVFVALLVGFTIQQRNIGAAKAVAGIEAKNNAAVNTAGKAGSASRDPSARGVRDPYTTSN
jgi:uncharacterized membrane protein YczE